MNSIDFQALRPVGFNVPIVTSNLSFSDYLGTVRVRWGIGRDRYRVTPGLYKVGNPDEQSDVLVSANYKLSFDTLRKNLGSLNVWILVIDTKGVNVWCAAGKGTFGTSNVVKSIKECALDFVVKHRRIIIPQLAATGVAAHKVKEQSGFKVIFGPVQAKDIQSFISAGYKATTQMRKIDFPMYERAKLIPVDIMYRKYYLLLALVFFFFLSGLDKSGFLFSQMVDSGLFPVVSLAMAYFAGIVLGPLFLNWIPLRAFALKGAFWGVIVSIILNTVIQVSTIESIGMGMINVSVASFMMMNFTGSSTYTSLSGVKKEMKVAIPFQITFAAAGLILFIISKLFEF